MLRRGVALLRGYSVFSKEGSGVVERDVALLRRDLALLRREVALLRGMLLC